MEGVRAVDDLHQRQLTQRWKDLLDAGNLEGRRIYLFGHCDATERLLSLMQEQGYTAVAILDNNRAKQGMMVQGVRIQPPKDILGESQPSIVLIAARAFAAMQRQLRTLGYRDPIVPMVFFDDYTEYSLSLSTRERRREQTLHGERLRAAHAEAYPQHLRIYCPYPALGDVCHAMEYLPYVLDGRPYVVFTVGEACRQTANLYGAEAVALTQEEMDNETLAVLRARDAGAMICHHERPYPVALMRIHEEKCMTLDEIYRCGIYGLPQDTAPRHIQVCRLTDSPLLREIPQGNAVILAPSAKSVSHIPAAFWERFIAACQAQGRQVYTNVVGDEVPLAGTRRLEAPLAAMQRMVERAGMFVSLRSGLCDVLRFADCRKVALYPQQYYSTTPYTVEAVNHIEGWENLIVTDENACTFAEQLAGGRSTT